MGCSTAKCVTAWDLKGANSRVGPVQEAVQTGKAAECKEPVQDLVLPGWQLLGSGL